MSVILNDVERLIGDKRYCNVEKIQEDFGVLWKSVGDIMKVTLGSLYIRIHNLHFAVQLASRREISPQFHPVQRPVTCPHLASAEFEAAKRLMHRCNVAGIASDVIAFVVEVGCPDIPKHRHVEARTASSTSSGEVDKRRNYERQRHILASAERSSCSGARGRKCHHPRHVSRMVPRVKAEPWPEQRVNTSDIK